MIQKIKFFFRQIGRILEYLPIIWRDRDFDHYYLFKLMEYKLGRMEKYFIDSTICSDNVKIAKQIMICKTLIKRIADDNYCEYEYDKLYKYIPDELIKFGRPVYVDNRTYEEREAYFKQSRAIHKKHIALKKHDLELFCKLFSKHYNKWWD